MRTSRRITSGAASAGDLEGLFPVRRLGHDTDVLRQVEEAAEALAHQGLVVHQEHADHAIAPVVGVQARRENP